MTTSEKREPKWVECENCDGYGGWWTGDFNENFEVCPVCEGMDGWWEPDDTPPAPSPGRGGEG